MLNAEKTTPEERIARIKAETNGRGAEIVVECVGRPEVFPEGLKYLRKAGMYLEQAARFRPSRKTAVRLKKRGGTGIPPVKPDLHHQIRCLSDHTTPFLLNKQNPEHRLKKQSVLRGYWAAAGVEIS